MTGTRYGKAIILVLLIMTAASSLLLAEEETEQPLPLPDLIGQTIWLETTGRGTFQGILLTVVDDRVELVNSDGEIVQISREAIEWYRTIAPGNKGRGLHQDSASNRLLVAPTAFPMEKGEFHIADQELAVVTASYGLNKNVSFWGGLCPLGAVFSSRFIANFSDSFAVSAGSFAGIEWVGMIGEEDTTGLILPYSLFSLGKSDNNITAGGGALLLTNQSIGIQARGAVAMVGGKIVLTATSALVSENWVIWGKTFQPELLESRWRAVPLYILSGLVFRIAGSRFSWDIGALIPMGFFEEGGRMTFGGAFEGTLIPIPWLAVTYRIR